MAEMEFVSYIEALSKMETKILVLGSRKTELTFLEHVRRKAVLEKLTCTWYAAGKRYRRKYNVTYLTSLWKLIAEQCLSNIKTCQKLQRIGSWREVWSASHEQEKEATFILKRNIKILILMDWQTLQNVFLLLNIIESGKRLFVREMY